MLHFATHSLLDDIVATRSALVLSEDPRSGEDGFLQAREIYNLELNADLVVFSACQTAGGKMEKGEGIQGLSRAFFCSGSRSVGASLWNVNDESTAYFMKTFYGFLAGGEDETRRALRRTKIRMCRFRRIGAPYPSGGLRPDRRRRRGRPPPRVARPGAGCLQF